MIKTCSQVFRFGLYLFSAYFFSWRFKRLRFLFHLGASLPVFLVLVCNAVMKFYVKPKAKTTIRQSGVMTFLTLNFINNTQGLRVGEKEKDWYVISYEMTWPATKVTKRKWDEQRSRSVISFFHHNPVESWQCLRGREERIKSTKLKNIKLKDMQKRFGGPSWNLQLLS